LLISFIREFSAARDSTVNPSSTPFDMILGRQAADTTNGSGSRIRSRLSPVTETHSHDTSLLQNSARPVDKFFEIVPPLPRPSPTPSRSKSQQDQQQQQQSTTGSNSSKPTPNRSHTQPHELTFARQKVPQLKPAKSALTAMLASSSDAANPFADVYAGVSGLGESASITLKIFFPHARKPVGKPLKVIVRKDATVEEVIGFSLFKYWEEDWEPKLDHGLKGEDDAQWAIKLSAVGWDIHIAEDDGEVDDDFPGLLFDLTSILLHILSDCSLNFLSAPDRSKRIATVNMDTYAIVEATPERGTS
jgi:target of rapamycin complex 2 subunit MAPKAP1